MCLLQTDYEIVKSAVTHSLWFWMDSLVSLPPILECGEKAE